MKIKFIVDSTFYLDEDYLKENDIDVVQMQVIIDDIPYDENAITPKKVMELMNSKKKATTTQPTPNKFLEAFEKNIDNYDLIICYTIARTLSGSYNSALLAKDMVEQKDKILVFDSSKAAFGGENNLELILDDVKKASSIEEIEAIFDKNKNSGCLAFKITNIMHLHNGGRVSSFSAVIGSLMKIKAIIGEHLDGSLHNDKKVRTESQVIQYFIEEIEKASKGYEKVFIKLINLKEDSNTKNLKDEIIKRFPTAKLTEKKYIGPVFTVHLGDIGYGIAVSVK